jgi:hypothetical protein
MSEDLVEEPFKAAAKQVEEAYERAEDELKSKVQKSKADALKKISG